MYQTKKHILSILTWGIIVFVIDQLCQHVTILTLLARRSNRFPLGSHVLEAISTINAFTYDIISFPLMWIRPQTMFDDKLWEAIIIVFFWGLTLHFTCVVFGLALRYFVRRRYRSRDTWSTTDRHDAGDEVR
jgi:hypothetical protein